MSFHQFAFKTSAFIDTPDKLAENVNEIHGHALASWVSGALRAAGLDASEPWAEDHGWDFSVAHGGANYLLACSVEEGEGGVVLHKARSLMDKLMGRNKLEAGDAVAAAVRAALAGCADVSTLSEQSAA